MLPLYCNALSQVLNVLKSFLYFSANTLENIKIDLMVVMNILNVDGVNKYLR